MGKKEKTKLKSKNGGGSDGHARDANNVDYSHEPDPAPHSSWGPHGHAGDRIEGFGPEGWRGSPVEEPQHLTWQPEPGGGGTWDAPAPNIGTLCLFIYPLFLINHTQQTGLRIEARRYRVCSGQDLRNTQVRPLECLWQVRLFMESQRQTLPHS